MVELHWVLPGDTDLALVELKRSVVPSTRHVAQGPVVIYRGLGTRFVDRKARQGIRYRYLLVAIDRAGNRSPGVARVATVKLMLLAPRDGSRVTTAPVLRWRAVRGARYYNVQLFRNGKKVLSAWPTDPGYVLARRWTYKGRSYRLQPGRYTWYVWPGLGPRANSRYGALLGQATFVVK